MIFDCIIIGGGATGLTAAIVLARACRMVVVIDKGEQSNKVSPASHNVFTRDGEHPETLYSIAREQLVKYPEATIIRDEVVSVEILDGIFSVRVETGQKLTGKTVLLAQGARYVLPDIEGIKKLWGTKVWHCPYCHGYEFKNKKIVAIGSQNWIAHMSVILPIWTRDISWSCINDSQHIDTATQEKIRNAGGRCIEPVKDRETIQMYDGCIVETIPEFKDGLARSLGCIIDETNHITCDEHNKTSIPGIFVAGDETHVDHQLSIAAASGHKAAMSINTYLAEHERLQELQSPLL